MLHSLEQEQNGQAVTLSEMANRNLASQFPPCQMQKSKVGMTADGLH